MWTLHSPPCCSSWLEAVLWFGMPFHGVYGGLDHTMAGIGRATPWLWTRSCGAKERCERAGGVRAAMRGCGLSTLVAKNAMVTCGLGEAAFASSKQRGTMVLESLFPHAHKPQH